LSNSSNVKMCLDPTAKLYIQMIIYSVRPQRMGAFDAAPGGASACGCVQALAAASGAVPVRSWNSVMRSWNSPMRSGCATCVPVRDVSLGLHVEEGRALTGDVRDAWLTCGPHVARSDLATKNGLALCLGLRLCNRLVADIMGAYGEASVGATHVAEELHAEVRGAARSSNRHNTHSTADFLMADSKCDEHYRHI
jgi:hypothetical protein